MKVRKVAGYINYDKSHFDSAGPLNESDEYLEKIWKSEHSLQQFVAEDQFKSYDDLKSRLNDVLGGDMRGRAVEKATAEDLADSSPKKSSVSVDTDEEEDAMSFFNKLAED